MYKTINGNKIWLRDGVSSISQLKPQTRGKSPVKRYDFHQMKSIFEVSIGFDCRGCESSLDKLGFDIPHERKDRLKYCDYWHFQIDAVFRRQVMNDQQNSIYVGTKDGIDLKKIKKEPNEWQYWMLEQWNELFHHLADKHGWIKIEMWW